MAALLVSDTSVLIDLDRGGVLEALFQLPFDLGVPDVLFDRELDGWAGPDLRALGLQVIGLDSSGVTLAQRYAKREPRLSTPDTFALALASVGGHILLAGDGNLRTLAQSERVECHGVLWVLDQLEEHGVLRARQLVAALETIASHPRCRLPRPEVQQRLSRYRATEPAS